MFDIPDSDAPNGVGELLNEIRKIAADIPEPITVDLLFATLVVIRSEGNRRAKRINRLERSVIAIASLFGVLSLALASQFPGMEWLAKLLPFIP